MSIEKAKELLKEIINESYTLQTPISLRSVCLSYEEKAKAILAELEAERSVCQPNEETKKAIRDAQTGEGVAEFESAEELIKDCQQEEKLSKDYEKPPSIGQLIGINNKLAKKQRQLQQQVKGWQH